MKTEILHTNNADFADGDFKKSSLSWLAPKCVSVALGAGAVAVRDTKDASKTTLSFTHEEWEAFVVGVKNGEFDV